MATTTDVRTHQQRTVLGRLRGDPRDPTYQAYLILRTAFVAAPILFGVDKFFNWMTFWPKYLWVGWPHFFGHVTSQHFMYAVGVVEIVGGLLVLLAPRFAPYIIAGWLAGITTNLVIYSWAEGGHTQGLLGHRSARLRTHARCPRTGSSGRCLRAESFPA